MDLSSIFSVLFRRWYAVLPVVFLVLLVGNSAVSSVETSYEATGKMLLLPPSAPLDAEGIPRLTNPFTSFDPSLSTTATAMTEGVANDPDLRAALAAKALSDDWQVETSETEPMITVTARAPIRTTAIATASSVLELLTAELGALQDGVAVPPSERITANVIVTPRDATLLSADHDRVLAGTIVLGILAVVAAGLAAEGVSDRRRRRRSRRDTPSRWGDRGADEPGQRKIPA